MKRWLLGLSAIVVVVVLALVLWRSSSLIVERTVIAELPLGINRLVPTDLDGDSEPEILAVCSRWEGDILPIWRIPDYERISDPRIWFIRSPFGKPKATQLPYVCYFVYWWSWDLSSLLPLQRSVLVEEGELLSLSPTKEWRTQRLGWLKIVEGQLTFEPLLTVKGRVTLHLIAAEKLPTMLFINDGTRSFAFRLQPNGTWQPIDPKRVRPIHGQYFGDFDGDGLRDAIMTRELHWHNKVGVRLVEVYWGDGSPATVLFEERPPKLTLTRIWTADVENDGCWEIVTWDGKDLTVWKFRKHERRFAPTTQVALKPPRVAPKGGRFSLGMATVPPPPARFEPNFAAIDLNGDGRKEFLLFWEEVPFATCGLGLPPSKKVAVQVVWQQGGKMQVRQFDPKEIPLPNPPTTTWTQNGHRFALAHGTYERKCFHPRLISFHPLWLQWWETVREMRSVILQLPNGDEALDLRRWTKIAELPAYPMLTGDWDSDGQMELLLQRPGQSSFQAPYWMAQHSGFAHAVLYFVRHEGKKVRWTKILPPSPAKVLHALPLKGRNGTAIFIVWELEDKAIIERLRWR